MTKVIIYSTYSVLLDGHGVTDSHSNTQRVKKEKRDRVVGFAGLRSPDTAFTAGVSSRLDDPESESAIRSAFLTTNDPATNGDNDDHTTMATTLSTTTTTTTT